MMLVLSAKFDCAVGFLSGEICGEVAMLFPICGVLGGCSIHSPDAVSRCPVKIIVSLYLISTLCLEKLAVKLLSHSCAMDMSGLLVRCG